MLRTVCGLIVMIGFLAGCSSDRPTSPTVTRTDPVPRVEGEKAATSSDESVDLRLNRHKTTTLSRPGGDNPRGGSMTRRTWKAAHRLERAVQDYTRENDGIFPSLFDYPNLAGKTVLDYLPSGRMLRNAFTGLRTEPSGDNAYYPGAIGYTPYVAGAINVGYVISAMGVDASEMLVLVYDPE